MKIFSWTSSVVIAAIGFGIVGVNALTEQLNVEIRDCDQGVSHCARQFKKVITVHEYNTTVANIRWYEVTTTSGLCEESIFHVVPGTTTVTVELNATTVKTIIPRVTSTITETSTQWEIVTSECLFKGAILF
ncbi:hypothetical protein F4823DRAFT_562001 [Ustulina deusta]|nr:hypothetical protein F4823DRAFT_562001 [Ustulina deusta]